MLHLPTDPGHDKLATLMNRGRVPQGGKTAVVATASQHSSGKTDFDGTPPVPHDEPQIGVAFDTDAHEILNVSDGMAHGAEKYRDDRGE